MAGRPSTVQAILLAKSPSTGDPRRSFLTIEVMASHISSTALPDSGTPASWHRRVFRNSFTRKGRRFRVKGWSVKIQFGGRRRTFSLGKGTRAQAAREGRWIYDQIRNHGWESVASRGSAGNRAGA